MPGPTLPRRSVVLGVLGAAAAGLAGPGLAGCSREGVEQVDGVRRDGGTLMTRHWPGHRPQWLLAAPATGTPGGLLVSLHGHGGVARSSFEDGLELQDLVVGSRLAIVSVDGGVGYWHARADGSDTGAMVLDDLVPLALRATGLPAEQPIGLLGWSMGGFGALSLATRLPARRVAAVVAESAALWLEPGLTPHGAFDDREDFDRVTPFNHLAALRRLPVRLDCGRGDPFVAANRALATGLPTARATFDAGTHDMAYWHGHARDQVTWVAQHF